MAFVSPSLVSSITKKAPQTAQVNMSEDKGEKKAFRGSGNKKERPPLSYTDMFECPSTVSLDVIGVVRSPYKERFGTPRQATVSEQSLGNAPQDGEIQLIADPRFEHALRGLEGFEYCWVICWMHLNTGWNPLVTPPRGPREKQGIFATRAPHRPNPISLSALRITKVDQAKRVVHVKGLDLLDGTPVLDLKPYVPYADAFPDASAGWLDRLDNMKGPDYLTYSPPPPHLRVGQESGTKPDEPQKD